MRLNLRRRLPRALGCVGVPDMHLRVHQFHSRSPFHKQIVARSQNLPTTPLILERLLTCHVVVKKMYIRVLSYLKNITWFEPKLRSVMASLNS